MRRRRLRPSGPRHARDPSMGDDFRCARRTSWVSGDERSSMLHRAAARRVKTINDFSEERPGPALAMYLKIMTAQKRNGRTRRKSSGPGAPAEISDELLGRGSGGVPRAGTGLNNKEMERIYQNTAQAGRHEG